MPFVKGVPRPPGAGRQKGTKNKKTVEFAEKMAKLKCDPQEYLAKVMLGKEKSLGEHPFMNVLKVFERSFPIGKKAPTPDQWKELMKHARRHLKYDVATLEQRITIARELLPYLSPKLKAMDIATSLNINDLGNLAAGAREILAAKMGVTLPPREPDPIEIPKSEGDDLEED